MTTTEPPALKVLLQAALLGLSLLGATVATALSDADILKPEEAFRYDVSADAREIRVRWIIAPEHYLYRQRMSFESRTPGVSLGPAVMPAGKPYEDEFFGPMEIYREGVEIRLPVTTRPAGATTLDLALKSQGCADAGLCYPPQTWTARVDLPAMTEARTGAGATAAVGGEGGTEAGGGLASLLAGQAAGGPREQPLPPEEAFRWSVTAPDPFRVQVAWEIAEGYYLYRHTLKVVSEDPSVSVGAPELPPGLPQFDEEYGDTLVFRNQVTLNAPLARQGPAATTVPLRIEFQGCKDDSICYPPQAVTVSLALPEASGGGPFLAANPASEQDRLFAVVKDGNILLVMALFGGLGLLLSFTPCCLPMYPILSGIIVGQGGNISDLRAFLLSLAYVLGMAVTYTILGAVFAAAGASVQAIFQHPWVIVGVAVLFVALALSMFGLFELQVPAAVQTRLTLLSGRQKSGSFAGAGLMGMISAAVVTTCVTPPLVAALTVIAKTGDVGRGALALFALALGMGIPLLAIGASAGRLMPRAGPWMVTVKSAFGLMMLAMAVWMLDRLWPGTLTLALWAVLLVLAGVFLGAFTALESGASTGRKVGKGLGLVATLYGAALLIGALAGNEDPLRPLQFSASPAGETARAETPFTRVKTVGDLDRELARAATEGRPVMLDFYADWCASCKEMEKYTFPDPAVREVLADTVLLQADVTDVDAADRELMRRFGVVGPPTIMFFQPDGREQENQRVVGFKPAAEFAAHVRGVLGNGATTLARAAP